MKCFTTGKIFTPQVHKTLYYRQAVASAVFLFKSMLSFNCFRSQYYLNGNIFGIHGHWTMEDGYDSEMMDDENVLYPFKVFT